MSHPTDHVDNANQDHTALLEARVRQQAAVAELGLFSLNNSDPGVIMDEAVRLLAETLDVDLAKVLELLPDGTHLLLRAGEGWDPALIGRATVPADTASQAGFALVSNEPVIFEHLPTETRFRHTRFLRDHGAISGMSVVIRGRERPFGVLSVHTRTRRRFSNDDIYFLRAIANTIAMTVERSRVDEELHRRHEEFRALAENAPDIIARFDREFRHLYINGAIERYTGIPAEEFIGKTNRELGMEEASTSEWESVFDNVFTTGQEQWYEFSFTDGEKTFWFQSRIVPEFDLKGSVRTVLAATRDITQQKLATEELSASEERFRSLSTSSPIGIVVADARGNIEFLNPRFQEITDAPLEEVLGRGWLSFVHPDDRRWLLDRFRADFAAGRDAEAEVRIDTRPHIDSWIKLRASPMFTQDRDVTGYVATVEDITDRKLSEQRLAFLADAGAILSKSLDVRETMEGIVNLSVPRFADMAMVNLLDSEQKLRTVSVAHADTNIGAILRKQYHESPPDYQEPHAVARVLRTGVPELIRDISEDRWSQIARTDEHRRLVYMFQPRSALVLPLVARGITLGIMSFVYSTSGRRYSETDLGFGIDLAERAALAIDNARLYQEAQDAIRIREEFLSIASHELKTPLTSVKGYAQILERVANRTPAHVSKVASRVREQAERLEALINDLLDVSRIQQGRLDLRLTEFDIAALAADVLVRFREGLEATSIHTLLLEAEKPVHGVWDAERIDQVLTNLLSNALKYSPDGGTVRVRVEGNEDVCILQVSDEGIGIPEEDQSDLFQPFKRTSHHPTNVTGTGLGLFIVRRIIEQHGGDIDVESNPGVGTTFTVRLPLNAEQHQVHPKAGTGELRFPE
jgi:PAS domain S-box-containing protein